MGALPNAGRQPSGDHAEEAAVALSLKSCIPFQLADDPGLELPAVPAALRLAARGGRRPCRRGADRARGIGPGRQHDRHLPRRPWRIWRRPRHDDREMVHRLSGGAARAGGGALPDGGRSPATRPREPAQLDALTSHIDILPTVLGFAGVDAEQRREISAELALEPAGAAAARASTSRAIIANALADDELRVADRRARRRDPRGRPVHHRRRDHRPAAAVADRAGEAQLRGVRRLPGGGRGGARRAGQGPGRAGAGRGQAAQPRPLRPHPRLQARALFRPRRARRRRNGRCTICANDPNEAVNLVEVAVSPPRARDDLPERAKVQAVADRLAALLARLERRDL